MKNYNVRAKRVFRDSNEIDEKTGLKKERQINEEFLCTKERYEFLKQNNAVELVEVLEVEKVEYSNLGDKEPKEIETVVIDRNTSYIEVKDEDIVTQPKVSIEKEIIKNNRKKKTSKK